MKSGAKLGLLLLLLQAYPICAQPAASQEIQVSLGGEWRWKSAALSPADMYKVTSSDQNWQSMQVPSNWFLQGHDLSGQVWMRKTFSVSKQYQGRMAQLIFEGVDYAADVWLNGTYLGFHEGYFQPFRFEVTRYLRFGSENVLVVRVDSPNEEFAHAWSLHKRLIKGVLNHHDTRPGGAWSDRGQEANTGGIWAPVYLKITDGSSISDFRVNVSPVNADAERSDGNDWNAEADLTVDSQRDENSSVVIETTIEPDNFSAESGGGNRQTVILHHGQNSVSIRTLVRGTQRWWSWDQGAQPLYRITLRILDGARIIDQVEDVIGFRTVRVLPSTQQWVMNGRRVFLRGTNYISTQWLSEMTRERYESDLALIRRANINVIRVHAHIEAQEFYRACDRSGVLVWQDFPLQWGYTEDPGFESNAVSQAVDMVSLLFDRPSVIAWSMHNEPPWDAPWMQYRYKDYDSQQNKQLDQRLYQAVSAADPSRYTHLASETKEHPWFGWYSGVWQDYGKPTSQPLITEFGAQALPSLPALKKIVGRENIWPASDAQWAQWEYHNFQRHETFDLAHVPKGKNVNELIANTQEYQARLIQFAAESYRRERYQPVAAIFQFMFVEDWPSMNWGIVDYWREPKPGYAALAQAYQPLLPSIAWDRTRWVPNSDFSLDLWAINDLPASYPHSRYVGELRRGETIVQRVEYSIDVDPDSGKKIGILEQKKIPAGEYVVSTRMEDANGQILGRDSFSFRVEAAEPGPARKIR
jgi:beta-mannosidase